jgi:hypothetical protein
MEQINSFILYKDWLILTRGKIEPRVGDIIKQYPFKIYIEISNLDALNYIDLDNCYVEVPYPVIKWVEPEYDDFELTGVIFNSEMFDIMLEGENNLFEKEKYRLMRYSTYKPEWLFDTIEEAKLYANTLLYND